MQNKSGQKSRVAFVTGGAGGIGAGICRALAKEGYAVAVGYHTSKDEALRLADALQAMGVRSMAVQCDVTDAIQIAAAKQSVQAYLGNVDTLVNNAGSASYRMFCDETQESIAHIMQTDLVGAMLTSHVFSADMVSARFGRIINIASVWGVCGAAMEVVYSAAKAGLIGFTKALGAELAPSLVTVNSVSPGFIDTPMNARFSADDRAAILDEIPACRFGTPQDVASAVVFLASENASYITGQNIVVSGGYKNI